MWDRDKGPLGRVGRTGIAPGNVGVPRWERGRLDDVLLVLWVVVPDGVVTVMVLGSRGSADMSIRYPIGRNVLNP